MDYAAAVKKLAGSGEALPRPVIQKPVENRVQQPAAQQNQERPASPVVKRNVDKDSLPPSYFSLLPSNFIKDLTAHLEPEAVSMLTSTNHFGNVVVSIFTDIFSYYYVRRFYLYFIIQFFKN
jgi:hypothetical protein